MDKIKNFIDGKYVDPLSEKYVENINPATGAPYSLVAFSNELDLQAAVDSSKNAFIDFKKTSPKERVQLLRNISKEINTSLDKLAMAETIDTGKPLAFSRAVDISRSSTNFEFFADCLSQFEERAFQTDSNTFNFTHHSPLGLVGLISPWNLPLYLLTWKIAPALAMGNCVIAKPSELSPMTAFLLGDILNKAGVPAGVVNILQGNGQDIGGPLCIHPDVKAVSFTGSTNTGRMISQSVASSFKKISLEMGGKNPSIIFDDCDFEKAVSTTAKAAFSNQGQICLCGSRIFVQEKIYNKFKDALVEKVKKLKVGDPLDEKTQVGSLIGLRHFEKVLTYLELAKKDGGKVLTGGGPANFSNHLKNGFFIEPTLFEGLPSDCRINQEEVFGPVATLIPFKSEDEVLKYTNSVSYGLCATLWTNDLNRAQRFSREVEAGIVWINTWLDRDLRTPFGGQKESGVGREGGTYGLNFFSEVKNICMKTL